MDPQRFSEAEKIVRTHSQDLANIHLIGKVIGAGFILKPADSGVDHMKLF